MSGQPENEEHLIKTSELTPKAHATDSSHKNEDQNNTTKSINPSTNNKTTPSINNESNIGCSRLLDQINVPEESQMGALQIQKIRNEKKETKKPKRFTKLTSELETGGPSCERDVVGDDLNKKKEVHILCECEPNVAGAAVPTVTSFISTSADNKCVSESSATITPKKESQNDKLSNTTKNKNVLPQKKSVMKANGSSPKFDQKAKLEKIEKRKIDSNNTANEKNVKAWQGSNQSVKVTTEKQNKDNKIQVKKPSLIPKLTKAITSARKSQNCSSDEFQGMDTFAAKLDSPSSRGKSFCSNKITEKDLTTQNPKKLQKPVTPKPLKQLETTSSTISSRVLGLQERLKATTSMLRQKIEMDKSKDQSLAQQSCKKILLEEIEANENTNSKKTVEDLYKNIFQLKDTVASLSESNTFSNQRMYIEKLFKNISEIKNIANKLCEYENDPDKSELADKYDSDKAELKDETCDKNCDDVLFIDNEKTQKSSANTKDNKIYIKFKPTRDIKDSRKKRKEAALEQSEGVQTDLSLGSKLTSESISSDTNLISKMKEVDSMDGVFIPTCEPPIHIEEEEETNGLDITITFPEFNQLNSSEPDHLPICLSDISAEALKRLKRCPKDFTLLMDFVQGKVLFQTGKGPTNNFSIGPDFKFVENIIDDKKSDIISIKPSTECSYASQLIPVDIPKPEKSVKSLKSTDSELFNVVNLPFLYKNPYLDATAGPKSCITLRNDKLMSMAILAKQFFKSMPQIPSLTNIFEDDVMENFSKTDSREKAEKSPESEKES